MRTITPVLLASLLTLPGTLTAQGVREDSLAVLAVADSALAAISRNDPIGYTDLMLEGATVASVRETSNGRRVRIRGREAARTATTTDRYVERGFRGIAMVDGPLAMVWLPYDFYVNGTWSHCGVDIFALLKDNTGWRIASLTYTVLQPPACTPHPEGPPT